MCMKCRFTSYDHLIQWRLVWSTTHPQSVALMCIDQVFHSHRALDSALSEGMCLVWLVLVPRSLAKQNTSLSPKGDPVAWRSADKKAATADIYQGSLSRSKVTLLFVFLLIRHSGVDECNITSAAENETHVPLNAFLRVSECCVNGCESCSYNGYLQRQVARTKLPLWNHPIGDDGHEAAILDMGVL